MVGAACVWRTQEGWTGRRYHLGYDKEFFDGEIFAVCRALGAIDQRQERGRSFNIFVNSTSAITRVRDDLMGPGQPFAMAAIEVCACIIARENRVNIQWISARSGAVGSEAADQFAKSAATGEGPLTVENIPEGYAAETSLSHMTRVATKAGTRERTERIVEHVRPKRRYRRLWGVA